MFKLVKFGIHKSYFENLQRNPQILLNTPEIVFTDRREADTMLYFVIKSNV